MQLRVSNVFFLCTDSSLLFFILALGSIWFLISLFIGNIESRSEGIYIGQCPRSGPSGSKRAYVGYIDDVSCDISQISLYFSGFHAPLITHNISFLSAEILQMCGTGISTGRITNRQKSGLMFNYAPRVIVS